MTSFKNILFNLKQIITEVDVRRLNFPCAKIIKRCFIKACGGVDI
jgi:hypothetical protein